MMVGNFGQNISSILPYFVTYEFSDLLRIVAFFQYFAVLLVLYRFYTIGAGFGKLHCQLIIHLLDSAEPDIRFIVQIEADVGRSEAESNIILDLLNKSNVRRGSVQQMLHYAEMTEG